MNFFLKPYLFYPSHPTPTMSLFHERDPSIKPIPITTNIICSGSERRGYEKNSVFFLHPFFNGKTEWPRQSEYRCYHDHHPFDSIPFPLPTHYDPITNTYTGFGIFCSASCAKGYLREHEASFNTLCYIWLRKMNEEVFGDTRPIKFAPPCSLLKCYGGCQTIEEFRRMCHSQYEVETHQLPFLTAQLAIELIQTQDRTISMEEKEK